MLRLVAKQKARVKDSYARTMQLFSRRQRLPILKPILGIGNIR